MVKGNIWFELEPKSYANTRVLQMEYISIHLYKLDTGCK